MLKSLIKIRNNHRILDSTPVRELKDILNVPKSKVARFIKHKSLLREKRNKENGKVTARRRKKMRAKIMVCTCKTRRRVNENGLILKDEEW